MRFEKLHIYGYGKLTNIELNLAEAMVIYGANEAGKSTIRSFIKSILFGFPIRGQYRYEPKTGSVYGGAITMRTEQGRIRVERLPKTAHGEVTVYFEDGTHGGEAVLQQLLQGVNVSLFDSVFSFDMHGLQNIHTVNRDDLGTYLFSAGAVGTDMLLQLEKKLDRELESLFKPNGRKPLINAGLQEAASLQDTLLKWRHKLDSYEQWQQKKSECELRLADIQTEKVILQQTIRDYEIMQDVQPLLVERQKYEDFLQTLSIFEFPADGIARYERLLGEWKPIQVHMQAITQKIDDAQKRIEELAVDSTLLEQEKLVEECRLHHISYEAARQEIQILEASMQKIETEIEELQSSVGIAEEVAFFRKIDTSIAAKDAIVQIVQKAQQLTEQKRQLDERFMSAQKQLEEQEENMRHVEVQLQSLQERAQIQPPARTRVRPKGNIESIIILLVLCIGTLLSSFIWNNIALSLMSTILFTTGVIMTVLSRNRQDSKRSKFMQVEHDIELRQLADRERFKLQQAEKSYERVVAQYEEWERATYISEKEIEKYKQQYALPGQLSHTQLLSVFERIEKLKQLFHEMNTKMGLNQLLVVVYLVF
jgi:uncharacterized protein YhaN